jgi:uncharacterized damage-inducible protein DinB
MFNKRQGAIGALLDIYEDVIDNFISLLNSTDNRLLTTILDPTTKDPNCRSLQAMLIHVVHAGFGYAYSIRSLRIPGSIRPAAQAHDELEPYLRELREMFAFTEQTLQLFSDAELEIKDHSKKIITGWQQQYDPEQLMEHAIVHILRHHRQIERLIGNAGLNE